MPVAAVAMTIKGPVAGVVLAGGRSLRMGQDKALLTYQGRPLVEHMMLLLQQAGVTDVFISGEVPGYPCLPDPTPHQGPGLAMAHVCRQLAESHAAVLFVPVDMPCLPVAALSALQQQTRSSHFDQHPLPAWVVLPAQAGDAAAVKDFMTLQNSLHLPLAAAWAPYMLNLNTPVEWKEACADAVKN